VTNNKLTLIYSTLKALIGTIKQLQLVLYSFSPNLVVISHLFFFHIVHIAGAVVNVDVSDTS